MTEREPEQQPPPPSSSPAKQKEKENFVRVDISKIRPKVKRESFVDERFHGCLSSSSAAAVRGEEHREITCRRCFVTGAAQMENKKELPKARLTFERAIQHGIEPSSVSPYLAEIAFLNRTYELIPNYLSMYKISGKSQDNLMPVLNYWLN